MDIITPDSPEPGVERFARFQSLLAGQCWRSQAAIPEQGIDADTVLLIQSIRWVDNAAHTIILRPHPSKIGTTVTLKIPQDDGSVRESRYEYREHRFLLKDFLRLWVFEPDHKIIRTKELQAIQGRVNELQAELMEAQSNPALMERVVKEALQERLALAAPKGAEEGAPDIPGTEVSTHLEGEHLASLAGGSIADAIGTGLTSNLVTALKSAASHQHAVATIQSEWIQGKTAEISTCIKAMAPFYEEQAAAALAHVEDVRVYVAKLKDGIESLDLYVGKDVHVTTIREGAPAPSDVPLTFVQRKLLMDEELAAWADVGERFDFESEERFFAALRESDDLVSQVFPTERCVLVMAVTRRFIDYGDNWGNYHRNEENKKVFLLARNGKNIHRIYSPVESHLESARLFPARNDQDQVFCGVDGREIKFQDVAYTDRLAAHERFALHYKRFLLLICGLDHRLKLFGDFYAGPPSLDFVSMDFQAKHCRFLHDDEEVIGESRIHWEAWVASKNAYLMPGSRVICNWNDVITPATAPGLCDTSGPSESYRLQYTPLSAMSQSIAYRRGDALCVDVEMRGYRRGSKEGRFTSKVELSSFCNGNWNWSAMPYLVLDAVTPEELHWYIHNREVRKDHLSYIRFFKRAEKLLLAERETEKAARQQMAQALSVGSVATREVAERIVQQAVVAWRAAHRGKSLPSADEGLGSSAWKALLNLMLILAGKVPLRAGEVAELVHAAGHEPLRMVVTGDAKWVVYAAPAEGEIDDSLESHAWVHRIVLGRTKGGWTEKSRSWALLPAVAAAEVTLCEWAGTGAWSGKTSLFASLERKQELKALASGSAKRLSAYGHPMDAETFAREFDLWRLRRDQMNEKSRRLVINPQLLVPVGLLAEARYGFLCIGTRWPHIALYRQAPDDKSRQLVRNEYARWFANKESAYKLFDEDLERDCLWDLFQASADLAEADRGGYVGKDESVYTAELRNYSGHDVLLKQRLASYLEYNSDVLCWISPDACDERGELALDEALGIRLPHDYEPVLVVEFNIHSAPDEYAGPKRWFDICPVGIVLETLVAFLPPRTSRQSAAHCLLSPGRARAFIQERLPGGQAAGDGPALGVPDGVERWHVPGR